MTRRTASDMADGAEVTGYLIATVGYAVGAAALSTLAGSLNPDALNAGVRRAFRLSAISGAVLASAQISHTVWYIHAGYDLWLKASSLLFFLGTASMAYGNYLWYQEPPESPVLAA